MSSLIDLFEKYALSVCYILVPVPDTWGSEENNRSDPRLHGTPGAQTGLSEMESGAFAS